MRSTKKNTEQKRSQNRERDAQHSPAQGEVRFKTQGMLFGDLDPMPFDRVLDPPSNACFNCWGFEHKRKDCTKSKIYDYCCNCGRSDITVERCPRCSKTFRGLRDDLKDWIYEQFFEADTAKVGDGKKQTTPKKERREDENWDEYCEEKQTTPKKERKGDENWNDCYEEKQTKPKKQSREDEKWIKCDKNEHRETAVNGDKFRDLKDEDFSWEPSNSYHSLETIAFAEPNDLFTYMRGKKIQQEFENDKINNAVNLNDTRMAGRDSLGDNSIVTFEDDVPKKNEVQPGLTGEPLRDFLHLLDAVKHLPVKTQDVVVLQYMSERKQLMIKKGVQFVELTSKSP